MEMIDDETQAQNVQKEVRFHTSNDHAGNREYVESGREGVDNLG